MNRSIVILKIIIFTWEVPGNDWPQTTVQHFNVFCCIYIVPSTLVKVSTPLYVMQPKIMALIFLFTNTFRSECFIAFSNHNLALVRIIQWPPSFFFAPRDSLFPVYLPSSYFLPVYALTIPLASNKHPSCFLTHIYIFRIV